MRLLFILAILMVLVVGGFFAVKNLPDRNAANVNTPPATNEEGERYNGFQGQAMSLDNGIMTLSGKYLSENSKESNIFDSKLVRADISKAKITRITKTFPASKPNVFGSDSKNAVTKSEVVGMAELAADLSAGKPIFTLTAYDDITGEIFFKAESVSYITIK
jgi:hypothetical protein